ncbi:hypothetical protein JCM8097_004850 [Rhodosporidiobolus ruineniae]
MVGFSLFSQGNDNPGDWNDSPAYVPGRFHAHALPTPSGSRASSVHSLPFASAPHAAPPPSHTRQRSRPRAFPRPLFAASPSSAEEQRNPFLASFLDPLSGALGGGVHAIQEERDEDDEEGHGWLRPGRERVERWMGSWWRRWAVLVGAPCLIIWLWCSIPFPVRDPYAEEPPWHIPWQPPNSTSHRLDDIISHLPWVRHRDTSTTVVPFLPPPATLDGSNAQQVLELELLPLDNRERSSAETQMAVAVEETAEGAGRGIVDEPGRRGDDDDENLPVDANFFFFLTVYYGAYLAIALVFITKLFDLYRLNWWPSQIGGSVSYAFFWTLTLLIGYLLHRFHLDGFGRTRSGRPRASDEWDWERKTTWVLLAFAAMSMPALACFVKLKADRRSSYRRSLTPAQKTFLERQLAQRMPRSYRRFLWFVGTLGLSLLALIIGQGFATVYLSTLPHSNIEGLVYVWTWILTINVLNAVSNWILQRKVRSSALVTLFRYYFFLLYFAFYRNLFARLRSPDQAVWITLLSSSVVIVVYPISMSRTCWRVLRWAVGMDLEYEDYLAEKGRELYLRNLSEVVTMIAFLGWLSILHWGPNRAIYPFFSFSDPDDPYTYRLTLVASLVIFAAELVSSWIARMACWLFYGVDVTNLGLDQFRDHPELVIASVATATHVLSDMLLFLVRLNFR